MRKSPLISTALLALLGGCAAAQAGTIYDWNELSPPEAAFSAQQRIAASNATQSMSTNTTPKATSADLSTPSQTTDAKALSSGDPPGEVSLSSMQKSVIARGAIAQAQSAASDFHPSMGAIAPQSLRLYAFDHNVEGLVPAAEEYDYVKLPSKDVLLVDPKSRKVVAVIERKDATGGK